MIIIGFGEIFQINPKLPPFPKDLARRVLRWVDKITEPGSGANLLEDVENR